MNPKASDQIKCDVCQVEMTKIESRLMPLKTCCSVKQIPLCQECYAKYAKKKKPKEEGL